MSSTTTVPPTDEAPHPAPPVPPGLEPLIELLDGAVEQETPEEITERVQAGLSRQIKEGALRLPPELCRCAADHYARNLVYRSESHGYTVVAMVWGEKQGTPLHDHAGTWCVEGVLEGRIEVTRYDLLDREGDLCRFERKESLSTGVGAAGSLIPPFDYHTIRNASAEPSVTLHVYGREMTRCSIFEPSDDGLYRQRSKQLSYDN